MDPTAAAVFTPNTRIIISITRDTRCKLWSVNLSRKFQRSATLDRLEKFLNYTDPSVLFYHHRSSPPKDKNRQNPSMDPLIIVGTPARHGSLRDEKSLIEFIHLTTFYDRHLLVFRFSASRASNFHRIEQVFLSLYIDDGDGRAVSKAGKSLPKSSRLGQVYYGLASGSGHRGFARGAFSSSRLSLLHKYYNVLLWGFIPPRNYAQRTWVARMLA